jgi:hypothetical protein
MLRQITAHQTQEGGETVPDSANVLSKSEAWHVLASTENGVHGELKRELDGSLRMTAAGTTQWDDKLQLRQVTEPMVPGKVYVLQFRARADRSMPVRLVTHDMDEPTGNTGLNSNIGLSREWKPFRVSFSCQSNGTGDKSIFGFLLGGQTGTAWFADVMLVPDLYAVSIASLLEGGTVKDVLPASALLSPDGVILTSSDELLEMQALGMRMVEQAPAPRKAMRFGWMLSSRRRRTGGCR